MRLIITNVINKNEFIPFKDIFSIEIIKEAAKKSLEGIGQTIKNSNLIKNTQLKKVNLTSKNIAGRVIFLLQINENHIILVMLKAKNDKKIGDNMTIKNSYFKKLLNKNIDSILEDIEKKNFEIYEL